MALFALVTARPECSCGKMICQRNYCMNPYDPVCAESNEGKKKTFKTSCDLEFRQCLEKEKGIYIYLKFFILNLNFIFTFQIGKKSVKVNVKNVRM